MEYFSKDEAQVLDGSKGSVDPEAFQILRETLGKSWRAIRQAFPPGQRSKEAKRDPRRLMWLGFVAGAQAATLTTSKMLARASVESFVPVGEYLLGLRTARTSKLSDASYRRFIHSLQDEAIRLRKHRWEEVADVLEDIAREELQRRPLAGRKRG